MIFFFFFVMTNLEKAFIGTAQAECSWKSCRACGFETETWRAMWPRRCSLTSARRQRWVLQKESAKSALACCRFSVHLPGQCQGLFCPCPLSPWGHLIYAWSLVLYYISVSHVTNWPVEVWLRRTWWASYDYSRGQRKVAGEEPRRTAPLHVDF